jgi:hypothetical protein
VGSSAEFLTGGGGPPIWVRMVSFLYLVADGLDIETVDNQNAGRQGDRPHR